MKTRLTTLLIYAKQKFKFFIALLHRCQQNRKCTNKKDLGILFDSQLTFKNHIEEVISKANRLFGKTYRFSSDIKSSMIIMKILNTYITLIFEYCSSVFSQHRVMMNRELERTLHQSKRFALKAPYRNDNPNYIDFNRRLDRLGVLTYDQGRKITSINIEFQNFERNTLKTHGIRIIENVMKTYRVPQRKPYTFPRREMPSSNPCD